MGTLRYLLCPISIRVVRVVRYRCADPRNAPRAGGTVVIMRSNSVSASKGKKYLVEGADTGREERRTVGIVDGDEETKVAEHKLCARTL